MTSASGSASDLPPTGTKLGGFRLVHSGGPQIALQRNLLLTLLLGIGGLVLLLLGLGMGGLMAKQLWTDAPEQRHENRGAFKMILFLIGIGGLGVATLFGTSALLFDSDGGFVERRRVLGLLRSQRLKSDLKSADLKIFTVPNGSLMCSFHVTTTNGKRLGPGVQFQIADPGAAALVRLALWVSRQYGIPYRVLMDPAIPIDSIPPGEVRSLIESK